MTATSLWVWLYFHFGQFFLELSGWVAFGSFLGLFAQSGIQLSAVGGSSVVAMGNIGSGLFDLAKGLGPIVQMAMMALVIATFFYVLLFIVATLITIHLPLRWTLLQPAKSVAARRFPGWYPRPLALLPKWTSWDWVRNILKVVGMLCIPVWALWVVVRFLLEANVRMLYGPAAEGVLDNDQRRALAHGQKPAILMLGIIMVLLMLLPVFNLIVPAVLCSSVCHLQRRGWICMPPTAAQPREQTSVQLGIEGELSK